MPLQIQLLRDAGAGFVPVGRALALAIDPAFTPLAAQIEVPSLTGNLRARLTADVPAVVGYGTGADIGTAGSTASVTPVTPGTPVEIVVLPGQRIGVRRGPGIADNTGTTAAGRVLMAFAGQVPFPAAVNPSSDPNTLDDYREGTFTPTVTAATPPSSVTYSQQAGIYTKIGPVIVLAGRVVVSSFGSGGSGVAIIGGLPFSSAQATFTTQLRHSGAALPASTVLGAVVSGQRLVLQAVGNQGAQDVPFSSLNAGFDLLFAAMFQS